MLSPHLLDLLREWDDFPRTASRSRTTSRCAAHRPIALGNCRGFSRPRRVPCWLAGAGGFRTSASAIGVPLSSLLSCLAERADRARACWS